MPADPEAALPTSEPKFPDNGETLTLVADGGVFGLLVSCEFCQGGGIDREPMCCGDTYRDGSCCGGGIPQRCRECSGSGELHQQWHAIESTCVTAPEPEGDPNDIPF